MKMFDIDDSFEEFMRAAYPMVRQTAVQYRESKRVFVAGLAAFYFHTMQLADECSEEEGIKHLADFHRQLEEFNAQVKGDRD